MPSSLILVAGRGTYPLELARSARQQGVTRLAAVAFKGETSKALLPLVDEVAWVHVGALQPLLDAVRAFAIPDVVMVGQIRPRNLFQARFDTPMREMLAALPRRNADTIFQAVGARFAEFGATLQPACMFMETCMPAPGLLTQKGPTPQQEADIQQGVKLARTCAALHVGQSVAIKNGTVLAVEGFEGTDRMIRRAGRLGGPGAVIVKLAQPGHDMRWDIPVVGLRTLHSLRKASGAVLAIEAGRCILLERDAFLARADALGIVVVVVPGDAETE